MEIKEGSTNCKGKRSRDKVSANTKKELLNPFMLFCKEQNEKAKKEGKQMLLKECGKEWDKMSEDEKGEYVKKYNEDKIKYKKYLSELEIEDKEMRSFQKKSRAVSPVSHSGKRNSLIK